jgi:hypothetical protein
MINNNIQDFSGYMVNYTPQNFETLGIDLTCFDPDAMVERFKNVEVTGINVLLLIFKPTIQKKINSIYLPDSAIKEDEEYNSMVGMVLQIGPDAYKGDQFPSGPYCKVKNWVVFPRGSSLQLKYEGEPTILVEDFKIKLKVDNPSKVSR